MAKAGRERRAVPNVPPRLNTRSVAEAVASQLRTRILDGDLVDGSELPPEAALLEQFPVSRPSLREAFRILETEGLLTVRRGKRGGTIIKHPTPDTAAYHVGLLLHARRTSLDDLATARNLVEPLSAEQAARRRDHRRIGRKLAALSAEAEGYLEDEIAFTELAAEFHQELVNAAGNQTLQLLVGVIESIWDTQELTWARSAVDEGQYPEINLRREVLRAHVRISEAIENGDAAEAVRLTRGHLKATSQFVSAAGGRVRVLDEHGSRRLSHLA
jgi:GntR family transcriptional repressor for pyruvate dehydrogenase complex